MIKNGRPTPHKRIYLLDSHPITREGLRLHVESTIDMDVCGESGTAEIASREIEDHKPDVVITELSLPDAHGLTFVQNVHVQCPDVRVLVCSMYHEDIYAERAIRAGAAGYLMKSESPKIILRALRSVSDGDVYLSRRMSTRILAKMSAAGRSTSNFAIDELTDREMTVFRMLGEGVSMVEIQERLSLSRKTVETHRRRAREKLGLDSVAELLQYAVQWAHGEGMHGNGKLLAGKDTE